RSSTRWGYLTRRSEKPTGVRVHCREFSNRSDNMRRALAMSSMTALVVLVSAAAGCGSNEPTFPGDGGFDGAGTAGNGGTGGGGGSAGMGGGGGMVSCGDPYATIDPTAVIDD